MTDFIKEALAEFADKLTIRGSGYELIVQKGYRSVSVVRSISVDLPW